MCRKWFAVILMISLMVTTAFNAYADVELIKYEITVDIVNADFSSGLDGWTIGSGGDVTNTVVTDEGKTCLKIIDNSNEGYVRIIQELNITSMNSTYYIEFKNKQVSGTSYIGFFFYDSDGRKINSSPVSVEFTRPRSWQDCRCSFIPNVLNPNPSKTISKMEFVIYTGVSSVGNEHYFTDFKIYGILGNKTLKTPVFLSASTGNTISHLDEATAGQDIVIKSDIIDSGTAEQPIMLLAGLYDQNNRQVELSITDNRNNLFGDASLTSAIKAPADNTDKHYMMAMVWDDFDNLKALDQPAMLSPEHKTLSALLPEDDIQGNILEINGTELSVYGSTDSKKAGDKVTLLILKEGYTSEDLKNADTIQAANEMVFYAYQITAGQNGKYSHKFQIDEDTPRGNYYVLIGGEGYNSTQISQVFISNINDIKTALQGMNGATSLTDIQTIITTYAVDFGLSLDQMNSFLYKYLLDSKTTYDTVNVNNGIQQLKNDIQMGIKLNKINTENDILLLDSLIKENASLFGINISEYRKINDTDSRKQKMLAELRDSVDFTNIDDFRNAFYKIHVLTICNNPESWSELRNIIETYNEFINVEIGAGSSYSKVEDKPQIYKSLLERRPFSSVNNIKNEFEAAVANALNPKVSKSKSSGNNGGGRNSITYNTVREEAPKVDIQPQNYIFDDLQQHWAKQDIEALYQKGFIKGKSERYFQPDDNITRAEFVTLISRIIKLDEVDYLGEFEDVSISDWFARSVESIKKAGIINGSDGRFRPQDSITREEAAKVIIKAYEYKNKQLSTEKSVENFSDQDEISSWAQEYVIKAAQLGLITGVNDSGNLEFKPKDYTTRAETAVIMKRFLEK